MFNPSDYKPGDKVKVGSGSISGVPYYVMENGEPYVRLNEKIIENDFVGEVLQVNHRKDLLPEDHVTKVRDLSTGEVYMFHRTVTKNTLSLLKAE